MSSSSEELIMPREELEGMIRKTGLTVDEFEAQSDKYVYELHDSVNMRDVTLQLVKFEGRWVFDQQSSKAEIDVFDTETGRYACEIGRYYIKTHRFKPGFHPYGIRETGWQGVPIIQSAIRGVEEETGLVVTAEDLITVQEQTLLSDLSESHWSSIHPRMRSRKVATKYRLNVAHASLLPTYGNIVALLDDNVWCICEWMSPAEREAHMLHKLLAQP